jgi:mRNA interferase MazF
MTPRKQPSTTNYKRGDVALVLFPNSDLRSAKVRPALIVQADNLNTGLPQLVVAMISSKTMRGNHPSRVLIPLATSEGRQSGLLVDSVVMTDNLATVTLNAIPRVIGSLPMTKVDAALRRTLGL